MHKLTQKERLSPLERVSLTLQHKEPDHTCISFTKRYIRDW